MPKRTCHHCSRPIEIPDSAVGEDYPCPFCGKNIMAPPDSIVNREKITLSVPEGLVLRHSGADDARRLRDAAVKAERQELIRLWRENQISDEVLHHIEEDLDYQESRI